MKKIIAILFFTWLAAFAKAQVSFKTIVPLTPIVVGEAFQVPYVIDDSEGAGSFITPIFKGFKTVAGPYIYPGKTKLANNDRISKNYVFTLIALNPGKLIIPGTFIVVNGKQVKSNDNYIEVLSKEVAMKRFEKEMITSSDYYLQPGEACAISIICASKAETSQISAVAMEDTTALMVPIKFMDEWMSKYKSWYYFVLETYRNRFEELLTVIDNVAFRNMDERLFFYLKRYTETNHSNTISLSHQQIADELNSSREVISRLLKKMEQRGLVVLNRNSIELNAKAAL